MKKFNEALRVAIAVRALRKNSDQDFNTRFHLVRIQLIGASTTIKNPHP